MSYHKADPLIEALAKRRLQLRTPPEALAECSGMFRVTSLLKWERGLLEPTLSQLRHWARILGCQFELTMLNVSPVGEKDENVRLNDSKLDISAQSVVKRKDKPAKLPVLSKKDISASCPAEPKGAKQGLTVNKDVKSIQNVSIKRLKEIAAIPDSQIDTTDIAELTPDAKIKRFVANNQASSPSHAGEKGKKTQLKPVMPRTQKAKPPGFYVTKPQKTQLSSIDEQAAIEEFLRTKGVQKLPTPGTEEFKQFDEAKPLIYDRKARSTRREAKADA